MGDSEDSGWDTDLDECGVYKNFNGASYDWFLLRSLKHSVSAIEIRMLL